MTRRLLPIVGFVTALTAGSAMAADVSALRTVPVQSGYNWTGCYVGVHAGGVAYRNNLVGTWADGGLFGGQLGCNYQIDHIVVGLEGEGTWSGSEASLTTAAVPFGGAPVLATVTTFKNEWDSSIAVRFGLAYDRFYIYEKVGAVWSDNTFTSVIPAGGGAAALSGSATSTGLLWGFGIEYGLLPKWTVRVETDFAWLSATNMNITCAASGPATCAGQPLTASTNAFAAFIKAGVNYRL